LTVPISSIIAEGGEPVDDRNKPGENLIHWTGSDLSSLQIKSISSLVK
jgi:hypothetical protein